MSAPARAMTAAGLLLVGTLAIVFLGGQVAMCLGPLGVTAVQCYAATGHVPEIGSGPPVLALCLGGAALCVAPIPRAAWRRAAVAAVVSGTGAAAAYVVLRPRTMEGPGSNGWYVVPVPLDLAGVATADIAGALVGALVTAAVLAGLKAGRGSSPRPPERSRP